MDMDKKQLHTERICKLFIEKGGGKVYFERNNYLSTPPPPRQKYGGDIGRGGQ